MAVEIDGVSYPSYATLEEADAYANAASHGTTWRDETDEDEKGRCLATATRMLDRQTWAGDKTDPDQELDWPRTGTGIDGVEDDEIPQDIIDACCEIAIALLDGSDLQNEANTAQKIQQLKAGSASITYFRGAEGFPGRFPTIIQELVGPYLSGGQIGVTGVATGTDGESVTAADFGLNRGL